MASIFDVSACAIAIAAERRSARVDTAHLMLALLECEGETRADQLLELCAVKRDEIQFYVEALLEGEVGDEAVEVLAFTQAAQWAQSLAVVMTREWKDPDCETAYLLIALAQDGGELGTVLSSLGLKPASLRAYLRALQVDAAHHGNPLKMLDDGARQALKSAHKIMRATYCGRVSTAHLLLGILADRELFEQNFGAEHGVNLDELEQLTRAAIVNDQTLGTPQIVLTPATKRALDRAKTLKRAQKARKIGLTELLWSLLPREATLRERLTWGDPDDALQRVWAKFDAAPIERVLNGLLGGNMLNLPKNPATKALKFDWALLSLGILWASLLAANLSGLLFFSGVVSALILFLASKTESRLRVGAMSFATSAILFSILLTFLLTSLA